MILYCTTNKLMNKKGVPIIMDALHTIDSAFSVYFPRNLDSSEPRIVPKIPATTAIPPKIKAALQKKQGQIKKRRWCGVVWCGVVWCGVVWCGVVWCGVVWCGVVWCGV